MSCKIHSNRCEADEADAKTGARPKQKKVMAVGKFAVPIPPVAVGGARRPKRQLSGSQQPHVAAWDLPSLDYLDEEQAIKYLHRQLTNSIILRMSVEISSQINSLIIYSNTEVDLIEYLLSNYK